MKTPAPMLVYSKLLMAPCLMVIYLINFRKYIRSLGIWLQ